jgi:hypothetical protein
MSKLQRNRQNMAAVRTYELFAWYEPLLMSWNVFIKVMEDQMDENVDGVG